MKINSCSAVVRFGLKESYIKLKNEPQKKSLIMLYFSSNGRRFKKSTRFKCNFDDWDINRQRVKTGKGMSANAHRVNRILNELQDYVLEEFLNLSNKDRLQMSILSTKIGTRISVKLELKKKNSLITFCESVLDSKTGSIAKTTERSYRQTIILLKGYSDLNHQYLSFEDIDMVFYRGFCKYMEKRNYSINSIGKHIKNLKIFLNEAVTMNISSNLIFKNKSFTIPKEVTKEIYLNEEELDKMASFDLSDSPKLQRARDIFLIGCYTGQRVSDYNGLTNRNIVEIGDKKIIRIRQKKTRKSDNIVHIPFTNDILNILSRYEGGFPTKMSEPVLRKNLKKAARQIGFTSPIHLDYTKGGEFLSKTVPMYQLIKTHTARRSFCTNYFLKGRPLQQIMLFSGHRTEREFLKYIRVKKEQEAMTVIENGFFN